MIVKWESNWKECSRSKGPVIYKEQPNKEWLTVGYKQSVAVTV